jgi:hypothetical protein
LLNQASYDDGFNIVDVYKNKEEADKECKILEDLKRKYLVYWVEEWEIK